MNCGAQNVTEANGANPAEEEELTSELDTTAPKTVASMDVGNHESSGTSPEADARNDTTVEASSEIEARQ